MTTYIYQAMRLYTKLRRRSKLRKQLARESKLVATNSMAVLKEFESLTELNKSSATENPV